MGGVKRWPNEMKHEMRRWDRDREWLARRFVAGWACLLVCPVLMVCNLIVPSVAVGLLAAGLLWSTRRSCKC